MIPVFDDHGPRDAAPLLLLHGFPFHAGQWAEQVDGLADTWRIITPDLRGQGRSPRGEGAVSIEFLVDDLIELLDHLGLEQVALGGLSMGGYVALRFVDRHPERVSQLLLFDTRAEADGNDARVARAGAIRAVRSEGMEALAKGLLPKLFPEDQRDGEAARAVEAMILATDPEGAVDALVAMASRLDLVEALERVPVPTLLVVGSEDAITPPEAAMAMADALPRATLFVIQGAGHVAPLSHGKEVNAAIRSFLT